MKLSTPYVYYDTGLKIHDEIAKSISLEAKSFSDTRYTEGFEFPYAYTVLVSKMNRLRHAIKTLPMFAGEIPEVNYRNKPKA